MSKINNCNECCQSINTALSQFLLQISSLIQTGLTAVTAAFPSSDTAGPRLIIIFRAIQQLENIIRASLSRLQTINTPCCSSAAFAIANAGTAVGIRFVAFVSSALIPTTLPAGSPPGATDLTGALNSVLQNLIADIELILTNTAGFICENNKCKEKKPKEKKSKHPFDEEEDEANFYRIA